MSKRELINTRERAVSDDVNRLQAFRVADVAEALRRLMGMRIGTADIVGGVLEAGSYIDTAGNDAAAIGTPLRGDVFDGLVVLPQNGSLNLLVSPGVVGLDDPDGQAGSSVATPPNPDDSRYKVVVDPGIQTAGALTIAAGSGSTRIDIVECRRIVDVAETASRDIFDPATGTVVPAIVNKVTVEHLTYRVRQGTPGAGVPAAAQGWLPLCICSVPSTATNVDTMTFWDVRPLVKDRVNAPHESVHVLGEVHTKQLLADDNTTGGQTRVSGISVSSIAMYRAGGVMQVGDTPYVDVRAAANHAAGYSAVNGELWYLFACFFTTSDGIVLPRWVRYTDTAPRVPLGPLGVMCVTSGAGGPTMSNATPGISPPSATGLGHTGIGAMVACGFHDSTPAAKGFIANGDLFFVSQNGQGPAILPSVTDHIHDRYNLTANSDYPLTARSVVLRIDAIWHTTADQTFDFNVSVRTPGGSYQLVSFVPGSMSGMFMLTSGATATTFTIEIPCVFNGAANGLGSDDLEFEVEWKLLDVGITTRSGSAEIVGWRL